MLQRIIKVQQSLQADNNEMQDILHTLQNAPIEQLRSHLSKKETMLTTLSLIKQLNVLIKIKAGDIEIEVHRIEQ